MSSMITPISTQEPALLQLRFPQGNTYIMPLETCETTTDHVFLVPDGQTKSRTLKAKARSMGPGPAPRSTACSSGCCWSNSAPDPKQSSNPMTAPSVHPPRKSANPKQFYRPGGIKMLFHHTVALDLEQLVLAGAGHTSPKIQHRPEPTPNPTLACSYVSKN